MQKGLPGFSRRLVQLQKLQGLPERSAGIRNFCAIDRAINTGPRWQTLTTQSVSRSWEGACWSPERRLFAVCGGTNPAVTVSRDGRTWVETTLSTGGADVCWGRELGLFVVVGASFVTTSRNGLVWSTGTIGAVTWQGVCYSSKLQRFVAVGAGSASWSDDGFTWNTVATPSTGLNCVAWSPELNIFTALGTGIPTWSIDGITWNSGTGGTDDVSEVAWSPKLGMFAAVATNGVTVSSIQISRDGKTWTKPATGITALISTIKWCPGPDVFVACPQANTTLAYYSANGTKWFETNMSDGASAFHKRASVYSPELNMFLAFNTTNGTNTYQLAKL